MHICKRLESIPFVNGILYSPTFTKNFLNEIKNPLCFPKEKEQRTKLQAGNAKRFGAVESQIYLNTSEKSSNGQRYECQVLFAPAARQDVNRCTEYIGNTHCINILIPFLTRIY